MGKKFFTLDKEGNEVLRDLEEENKNFNRDDYLSGKFDGNNYQWHEMFDNHVYDDNGCDYERYGCYIKEGDVVLDLGGNIGVFAHRAEFRGASKVISFEPLTPTFNCLIKNRGPKTLVYKMAVGSKNEWIAFKIHTDFTNIGGGSSQDSAINGRKIIHEEKAYVIGINEIFNGLADKIDFMKIDIEGGEVDVLNNITDTNLLSLRCLSAEFHKTYEEFDIFQENFVKRMNSLGFRSFVLYLGDGNLRTINFWKE
jgi:FkbM family methyltransferase